MAALLMLAGAQMGCDMAADEASAKGVAARSGGDAAALARAAMTADDPLALLRQRGARIDQSFAESGNYPFELPGVAARGSVLAVALGGEAAPTTLTLVLPAAPRVTLTAAAAALGGEARRLPALPGKAWQYGVAGDGGRYRLALSGDPAGGASRVTELTVIRDR